MRRLVGLLTAFVCLFAAATPAAAKFMYADQGTVSVKAGEVVNDDLWIAGQTVEILGTVNGDVYAAGETVKLGGTISGDLLVVGGNLDLSGKIGQDLYLGGGNVNLNQVNVGDTLVAGAATLYIDGQSQIRGSLIAGSGNMQNKAPVGRNLLVGAGNLDQNAPVAGEARVAGGSIILGSNTKISKDLTYAFDDKGRFDNQASVSGTTTRYTPPVDLQAGRDQARRSAKAAFAGYTVFGYLSSLVTGLFFLWLFRRPALDFSQTLAKAPWPTIGRGFLVTMLSVPTLLILALTIVGTPLALILLALVCIAFHLAKLVTALTLGKILAHQFGWTKLQVYVLFFLGLTVLSLLRAIPVVGWFASVFATWAGMGTFALALRHKAK